MLHMGVTDGGSGKAWLLKFKEPGFSVFRPFILEGLISIESCEIKVLSP